MKNVLLIVGHPDAESFNFALADAYAQGVGAGGGANFRRPNICELRFNSDLVAAWEAILWADHLVWLYPVWWGSVPAITKGLIDRVFPPGFAFRKHEGSKMKWDELLKGETARLISALYQPDWFYRCYYSRPSHHAMKGLVMQFTGVANVRSTTMGPIRLSTPAQRAAWLAKAEKPGSKEDTQGAAAGAKKG